MLPLRGSGPFPFFDFRVEDGDKTQARDRGETHGGETWVRG